MNNQLTNTLKRAMLKAAAGILDKEGFHALSISYLAERMGIEEQKVHDYFPLMYQLNMEAMEYSAQKWCDSIFDAAQKIEDVNERLYFIINEFAFGTDKHAGSLSCYIDVWGMIRNMPTDCYATDKRIKIMLSKIYEMYVNMFLSLFESVVREEMLVRAWLLVVISDGLHIQNLLDNTRLDRAKIVESLCDLLMCKNI